VARVCPARWSVGAQADSLADAECMQRMPNDTNTAFIGHLCNHPATDPQYFQHNLSPDLSEIQRVASSSASGSGTLGQILKSS